MTLSKAMCSIRCSGVDFSCEKPTAAGRGLREHHVDAGGGRLAMKLEGDLWNGIYYIILSGLHKIQCVPECTVSDIETPKIDDGRWVDLWITTRKAPPPL